MTIRTAATRLSDDRQAMAAGVPAPRCSHWPSPYPSKQCDSKADGLLSTIDGARAWPYCAAHGLMIVTEYHDKLGEDWPWLAYMEQAELPMVAE